MMGDTIAKTTAKPLTQTTDDIKRGERIVAALDIMLQDCDDAREKSSAIILSVVSKFEVMLDSIKAKNAAFYEEAGASRLHYIAKSKISEVDAAIYELRKQIHADSDDVDTELVIIGPNDRPPVPSTTLKREFEIVKIALSSGGYTLEPVDIPDTELRKCDVCREEMEINEMDLKGRGVDEPDSLNAGGWQYVCRKMQCRQGW